MYSDNIEEPQYIAQARLLLRSIFNSFLVTPDKAHIDRQDIVRLIRAKHAAFLDGCGSFEKVLLDIVKELDEMNRDSDGTDFLNEFIMLIRSFERYDQAQSEIGQMAFTENYTLTEVTLRSFLKIKQEFDKCDKGLFNELFIDGLMANEYLSYFGKKKVKVMATGLEKTFDRATIYRLLEQCNKVLYEERLYRQSYALVKTSIQRKFRSNLDIYASSERLRQFIIVQVDDSGLDSLPEALIEKIQLDLRKEFFYIYNILPVIKDGLGRDLREDFIRNSGLDKYYIEQIESKHLTDKERQSLRH